MRRSSQILVALLALVTIVATAQVRWTVPRPIQRLRQRFVLLDFAGTPSDWPQFNFDARHSGVNAAEAGMTPDNVATMQFLFRTQLPGVADGAPAYWAAASTDRKNHTLFFTTNDGTLVALSAEGAIRWQTTPPPGPRWTTSSPALDPSRLYVYSYALDGRVHKYETKTGIEVFDSSWPVRVTKKPDVEKGSAALSIATAKNGTSYLYASLSAYPEPGDEGDYQGHVTAIRLSDGRSRTFNVLCSQHQFVLGYGDCSSRQAGVWGRPGVIYNEADDSVYIVSSNGPYDGNLGGHDWGNSILRLSPDLRAMQGHPRDSYTPAEYERLDKEDLDLGSSAIALLPRPGETVASLAVHAGKDMTIRLIDLRNMSGQGGPGFVGGELQALPMPQRGYNFAAPAVWSDAGNHSWVFFANTRGISAFELVDNGDGPQLAFRWQTSRGANSSPVVVNGVLFSARDNRISALDARTGNELWADTRVGDIHWQSPIVVNGALYISDMSGALYAYSLPKQLVIR